MSNQLRYVNIICSKWRDATVEKGKVDDRKVKIVTFTINFGCQSSIKLNCTSTWATGYNICFCILPCSYVLYLCKFWITNHLADYMSNFGSQILPECVYNCWCAFLYWKRRPLVINQSSKSSPATFANWLSAILNGNERLRQFEWYILYLVILSLSTKVHALHVDNTFYRVPCGVKKINRWSWLIRKIIRIFITYMKRN